MNNDWFVYVLFQCFICSWQIKRNIIFLCFVIIFFKKELSCFLFKLIHILHTVVFLIKYLDCLLNLFFFTIDFLNRLKVWLFVIFCDEELAIFFLTFGENVISLIRIRSKIANWKCNPFV